MTSAQTGDVQVRGAMPAELPRMARCHVACFPAQVTSRMGRPYTEALYASYLRHPDGIALVAVDARGDVLGVCVGGAPGIYRDFLAAARRRFAGTALRRIVTLQLPWTTILARAAHALALGARRPAPGERLSSKRGAVLQIIAVHERARSTGVADRLLEAFRAACAAAGYAEMRLSVEKGNTRALRFYQRHGWRSLWERGEVVQLHLVLGPLLTMID